MKTLFLAQPIHCAGIFRAESFDIVHRVIRKPLPSLVFACKTIMHGFLGFGWSVPEPERYAMLLVGLGLLGFMARRRKETPMQFKNMINPERCNRFDLD